MGLIPEVLQAFETLGIDPAVSVEVARSTYKKLALQHHPDRNFGDSTATLRFQKARIRVFWSQIRKYGIKLCLLQISKAWEICQKHYDHPEWSNNTWTKGPQNPSGGRRYTEEDEVPLDEFEAEMFFR